MKITPLTLGIGAVGVGGVAAVGYGVSTLAGGGGSGPKSQDANVLRPTGGFGRRSRAMPLDNNECQRTLPLADWTAPSFRENSYIKTSQFVRPTSWAGPDFRGCTGIVYSNSGGLLSLKSETRMISGRLAMLLISSISSIDADSFSLTHHVLFLEQSRATNKWETKDGYGWGGDRKPIKASKLKLRAGPSEDLVDVSAMADGTSRSLTKRWSKEEGKEPIDLEEKWYAEDHISGGAFTFDPHTIRGFGETWLFTSADAQGKNVVWKEYCTADEEECGRKDRTQHDSMNVLPGMIEWYKQFRGNRGTWK